MMLLINFLIANYGNLDCLDLWLSICEQIGIILEIPAYSLVRE